MKNEQTPKLLVFVLFTLIFSINGTSQEDKSGIEIKLYSNFSWKSDITWNGEDTLLMKPIKESLSSKQLGYFTPAVSFSTQKGNFHELELSRMLFNQRDEVTYVEIGGVANNQIIKGERNTAIYIALRYEYNLSLSKKKPESRFKPMLGFGISPFFSKSNFNPKVSTTYSTGRTDIAALFSIVPRIKYEINKRWFFDLNVPFNLAQFGILNKRRDNPELLVQERSVTTFNFSTLPNDYLIRFGIGLKL